VVKWLVGVLACVACKGSSAPSNVECGAGTMLGVLSTQCFPTSDMTCGPGTHEEDDGTCVADPRLEIRATPTIVADGRSATEVVVFGREADGSPSHVQVVLTVDRASAGTFVSPAVGLDDVDAESAFVPCNSHDAACLGPATLQVALASAPMTPVATVQVQLVAPTPIGSAAPCLGGGDILYFNAAGWGYNGEKTFSSTDPTTPAVFDPSLTLDDAVTIGASIPNGPGWGLQFQSRQLGIPLIASTYPNAVQADIAIAGQPGLYINGQGDLPANCPANMEFEIETYDHTGSVLHELTATFHITCSNDTTKTVTGCVHYSP